MNLVGSEHDQFPSGRFKGFLCVDSVREIKAGTVVLISDLDTIVFQHFEKVE